MVRLVYGHLLATSMINSLKSMYRPCWTATELKCTLTTILSLSRFGKFNGILPNRDSAGQDDYSRLRPLGYADADVFLMCYSVADRDSFKNVDQKVINQLLTMIVDSRVEDKCSISSNNIGRNQARHEIRN